MEWIFLLIISVLYSSFGWSQSVRLKTIKGKVTFEKDSTDWVAAITEKDSVSVLFKMMFDKPLHQSLPPNGYYAISYGADIIQFARVNQLKSYSFYTDHVPASKSKKGEKKWLIIGLAKMNPVCIIPKK